MLIEIIYFLLPGALANMMPVFVKKKMEYLNYPLDFGLKFGDKRLLGENKTFRGLFAAIIGSIFLVYVQSIFYDFQFFRNISFINYFTTNFLVLGFLIGFGVMFGDALGSFFKRRVGYAPGKSFFLIDQINGIIGMGFFVFPFYLKSFKIFLYCVLLWTLGHLILKFFGYLLKIDNKAF